MDLAAAVADLQDREQLRELTHRFAHAVDRRDLDALVDLFVDDVDAGAWGKGTAALRQLFNDVLRSFTTSVHFVTNHVLTLDGDRATGTVYCRSEQERDGRWVVRALLYEDSYARRDGRWRFVSRRPLPWYETEMLDPPTGDRKLRLPGRPPGVAPIPGADWPTWERFWGHADDDTGPSEVRTARLPAAGLELVADIHGDEQAPAVLLLHGGGQTRHSWGTTARALGRRGWRAVSIDARGHGESDWSPDGWYGFERYADDVRAVAVGFAVPVLPVLVGASLGGVASMLAIGASDEPITSGLILVDVAHRLNPDGQRRIGEFMLGNPEGFESLEQAADAVAAYIPHRPRPRDLSGLRKNLRQRDDGRWVWHWDPRFLSKSTPFPTDELVAAIARIAAMELPTLLVRGRLSDIVDEEQARELQQLIPHARVVDVAGAGHMVAGDSNDLFNEAVLEFVDSVRKSDDAS
jgi:pimeloyl-ACP methyl ester carboxylesterase/ketosteroid isomerase-like protein